MHDVPIAELDVSTDNGSGASAYVVYRNQCNSYRFIVMLILNCMTYRRKSGLSQAVLGQLQLNDAVPNVSGKEWQLPTLFLKWILLEPPILGTTKGPLWNSVRWTWSNRSIVSAFSVQIWKLDDKIYSLAIIARVRIKKTYLPNYVHREGSDEKITVTTVIHKMFGLPKE